MNYNNLDENSPKICNPVTLNIELMEHQKTAIKAMANLEDNGILYMKNLTYFVNKPLDYQITTTVGILGDKVGSGKSLMVIALILNNRIPNKRDLFYESSKYVSVKLLQDDRKYLKSNLLIVPQKLTSQWIKFFEYAPDLKLKTCLTDESINITELEVEQYDVILVPCNKTVLLLDNFKNYSWARILIDEADTITLPKDTILNANFLWLITGTPNGILYSNKTYLNNIFQKNKSWMIDCVTVKNNKEFIDASRNLPKMQRVFIECLTPAELNIIKDIIPKHILSMINAGNSAEAIKLLNCNEDTQENILKVITKTITDSIKNKNIELEAETQKEYHGSALNESEKKIKYIKSSINNLQEKLETIKKRIYEINDDMCPICMDSFTRPLIVRCCKNIFCFDCLTLSISKTYKCPFCQQCIGTNDMNLISDNTNTTNNNNNNKKEKIDVLLELINNKKDGKFLVFANFPETFRKIELVLKTNKILYKMLKGTSNQIMKIIDDFQKGLINVLLLNAKNFGAGLNLEMATDVVIYHRFTNEMEEQVIGRAHRIGRKTALTVYYLLHNNENKCFDQLDENYENYSNFLEKL